jgi:hypothetical protein
MPSTKQRFDQLLKLMVTVPLHVVSEASGRRAKEYPASDAETSADCDETQTPKDTSEDAER